jgi:hypothetical protein
LHREEREKCKEEKRKEEKHKISLGFLGAFAALRETFFLSFAQGAKNLEKEK